MTLDKVVIDVGKKEFSAGLTFVACSRVRRMTDLLFVPPFPFQRVSGLCKSQRLKERQQEDRRLLRMNDGSHRTPSSPTLPESKRRAKVPKDEPGPSQPSTPETEGQPDLPKVSRDHQEDRDGRNREPDGYCLRYNPGDTEWQRRACVALGLHYHRPNGVAPGGPDIRLTYPVTFKSIRGDGNCLFRALSYIITGSEDQHMSVRRAIVSHMRSIGTLAWEYVVAPTLMQMRQIHEGRWSDISPDMDLETGIEQYIAVSEIEEDRAWGSEVEIMILAHLLDTPIASYVNTTGWTQYNPGNVYGVLDLSQCDTDQAHMYIRLSEAGTKTAHYDVVTSVEPSVPATTHPVSTFSPVCVE